MSEDEEQIVTDTTEPAAIPPPQFANAVMDQEVVQAVQELQLSDDEDDLPPVPPPPGHGDDEEGN